MSRFQLEWKITENDSGKQIKEFLKENEISKTALTDIKFRGGSIHVNESEVTVRYELVSGDTLKVAFPADKPSEGIIGECLPFDIISEDNYVLVVNKSAGMSTIPSREHPSGSLANALIGYYEE